MTSILTGILTRMFEKSMWRAYMAATVRIGEVHVQVFVCVKFVCVCVYTNTHIHHALEFVKNFLCQ